MRRKTRDTLSGGLLALFALPFAGTGVAAVCYLGWTVWTWQRMTSWASVPAEIVTLDLEQHTGDKSTTYKVAAHYRYTYQGRQYEGDRAALASMSDNIGDFQRNLYRQLRAAQRKHAAVAYVDSANPADATLNRDLRGSLLVFAGVFALAFGGVGFGLLFRARLGAKKLAEERELERRYPLQPWRWNSDWKDGRIAASNRANAYGVTIFAALWNLISLPVSLFVPTEISRGNGGALVALLFPLIGAGLAFWAVWSWLRLKRFKQPTLMIEHMPILVGGRLQGTVKVEASVPVTGEFRASLCCIERTRGRNSSDKLLWQTDWIVPKERCQITPTYSMIPIDAEIPKDLPETSVGTGNRIVWRLGLKGECPGPDFVSTFDVPVFDVPAGPHAGHQSSSAPAVEQPSANDAVAAESGNWLASLDAKYDTESSPSADGSADAPPEPAKLAALGIVYQRWPEGTEAWTFRRARHKSIALGLTLAALVWSVICAGLWYASGPWLFRIVFSSFDAIFVAFAWQLWFAEYRVRLDEHTLTIFKRGLFSGRARVIPRREITDVRARRGMKAGDKLYYDVKVETGGRRKITAASSIDNYTVAEWLATHWLGADRAAAPRPAVSAQSLGDLDDVLSEAPSNPSPHRSADRA